MTQMPTPAKPKMPSPIAPHASAGSTQGVKDLHPAALEAVAAWNNLHKERDQLEADIYKTRNDLEVANRHIEELQHQLDRVTERRDYFQRYAVQANSDLQHVVSAANNLVHAAKSAMERSLEVAHLPEPEPLEDIEQGLADIAQQLNGGKDPMPTVVNKGPKD